MPAGRAKQEAKSVSPTSDDPNSKDSATENSKNKRKRQSQSCDACRARKVRCARDNPEDSKQSCKHCIALGIPCTYDYQPKKRGPPNLYLRRLQEAAAAAAAQGETRDLTALELSVSPVSSHQLLTSPTQTSISPTHSQQGQSSYLEAFAHSDTRDNPNHTTLALFYRCRYLPQSLFPQPYGSFSTYNWSYKHHQPLPVLPPAAVPPLSYYYRPHRTGRYYAPGNRGSDHQAILRFCLSADALCHKPSFMADLHDRREERDPLFFALVMSTAASTLVQMPKSYLPMRRSVVRKLAQTCYEASRHITIASYDPPTSMHVVIRYFDCIYHFCEGHDATQHAAFGEAAHIAVTLCMHEEGSYEGLDPIECEIRRRTFWLLFGGRPICLRDEDCTVHYPKELDDEYITSNVYLSQPPGKTAIVSGLNYISRIFALLGEILVRIRVDKRSPPQGQFATARLEEVQSLHSRIVGALTHTPEPLRLKRSHQHNHLPSDYGGAVFRQNTFAEVKDFFDNPKASRANALNPFLVMQANLYVTQQLVRFVIEQYRDELVASLQGRIDDIRVVEDREAVASDLLNILHSIPIQSIATNGPSLVHKVRFVASTLLDAVRKAETAPASAARAHAFLWDFLSILSEIERNYLLDDDRDPSSTGEGIPIV
ncbi:hypothetical protein BU15DRAFT_61093 [Melanogaster broomeanus]|nr:hypothetical protein BU15DRAFT_61093 [Melanogaster broomeanus]